MPRKSMIARPRSAKKLADGLEDRMLQQKTDRSKQRAIEAAERLNREMQEFIKNATSTRK